MSTNKYKDHLLLLPEDEANRQIANGFQLEFATRQLRIETPAGGWPRAVEQVDSEYRGYLREFPMALLAILIDLDGDLERPALVRSRFSGDVRDRIFILGAANEPEDSRRAGLGGYEAIGTALARDCREGVRGTWGHEQLRHNVPEAERLRARAGWLFNT